MDPELEKVISASPIEAVRGPFYVVQLDPETPPPLDAICMFWDHNETTAIVTPQAGEFLDPLDEQRKVGPFGLLRLRVAAPFVARGFIAAVTTALADESINVYLMSTFSFDLALVRSELLDEAVAALIRRGFPGGEVCDAWR